MLVYGDHSELADPRQRALEINRQVDALHDEPPGLERHAKLVGALVDAGQLLQGIADAAFDEKRVDRRTAGALDQSLLELGRAVCRSWDSGFRDLPNLPRLQVAHEWPAEVELRLPEGYAFYALYPEAYIEAARQLALKGPPRVIGIRSIGTSLGAIVAAALDAPPAITVRPFGDPFSRGIAIDPALGRELLDSNAHYVIVDEGPGHSGSSFAAVAKWLGHHVVPSERIAVLPSHAGVPGPAATDERRRWWGTVQRQVGDFGDRCLETVERWCAQSIGSLDEPPRDISAGAWRQLHYARGEDWPGIIPAWERRKFLAGVGGERFLLKFGGLARIGEDKLATARALHSERLVPEPLGLMHGFIVERWLEGATPLADDAKPVAEIGHYISTRANLLPASSGSGASIEELLRMTRRNITLEFGEDRARVLARWADRTISLDRRVVRRRTDNKLDRHEWLRTASGSLIKTDALDHHRAHDLIGCQDVAWDVAGAIVEFDLGQSDCGALLRVLEAGGTAVDRELLDFCGIAYSAFRLGHARLGATISDTCEQQRLARNADRYRRRLQHLLESTRGATRPTSLVG